MKSIFFMAMLFSWASAFSKSPCPDKKMSCMTSAPITAKGVVHALTSPKNHFEENAGFYFTKGVGKSCAKAQANGMARMMDKFDYLFCGSEIKCGPNGRPYVHRDYRSCRKLSNGKFLVWIRCDNIYHSEITNPPAPQGAGILLIPTLKRQEVRARASK
jgi:hypothetical protein